MDKTMGNSQCTATARRCSLYTLVVGEVEEYVPEARFDSTKLTLSAAEVKVTVVDFDLLL